MTFSGKLLRDGQVILDRLSGEVFGSESWKGNFSVPAGTYLDKLPYDLVLDDGCTGSIAIQAVYVTGERAMLFFDGRDRLHESGSGKYGARAAELAQIRLN